MAPRRLLLLLPIAAACSLLAAASQADAEGLAAEPVYDITVGFRTTDPGTAYDVTVFFFRGTRRVAPPRLRCVVLPPAGPGTVYDVTVAFHTIDPSTVHNVTVVFRKLPS